MTTVFVDQNCVVCARETSQYKRIALGFFEIMDILRLDFDTNLYCLNAEELNKNMHIQTPKGELIIGVDAFAPIWDRIDQYNFAVKLFRNSLIKPLAKIGYKAYTVVGLLLLKNGAHSPEAK